MKIVSFAANVVLSTCFVPVHISMAQDSLLTAHLNAARQHVSHKQFSLAIQEYKAYLVFAPSNNDVRNELARTYSWNSDYDSALIHYKRVLAVDSSNYDARYGRAQVLAWQNDYTQALKEIGRLLGMYPRNVEVLLLAARVHHWSGQLERSLELYRRVLSADSLNDEANVAVSVIEAAKRPKPMNQVVASVENNHFTVPYRTDHRAATLQYFRTINEQLKVFADLTAYRKFDREDQAVGIGAYYTLDTENGLYGFAGFSMDPKVISAVDVSVEYTRVLPPSLSLFVTYRTLLFKDETAHIASPGCTYYWQEFIITPRVYVSRAISAKTFSSAYSLRISRSIHETVTPFVHYVVGSESFHAVTLDNVGTAHAWSVGGGIVCAVSDRFSATGGYQYLYRIGVFHESDYRIALSYSW